MVKIDGSRARAIREDQGLTQLYVATAVGVTTDTISRWENNRYPAIKRENGLKLAEALSVDINELLEAETESAIEETVIAADVETISEEPATSSVSAAAVPAMPKTTAKRLPVVLVTLLVAAGTMGGWFFLASKPPTLTATRYVPAHFIAGQPFPVIIEIQNDEPQNSSYVVKENIPADTTVLSTLPKIKQDQQHLSTLKWLNKDKSINTYSYSLKTTNENEQSILFSGSLSEKDHQNISIKGQLTSKTSMYHWADTDSNGKISDQEIMQAYNRYAAVPGIDFEMIEEIWMGNGYFVEEKNATIHISD